jgi:hypothetical protein
MEDVMQKYESAYSGSMYPDSDGDYYLVSEVDAVLTNFRETIRKYENLVRKRGEQTAENKIPPVDRSKVVLTDGSPVIANHRKINPATGQQEDYIVLSEEERHKGFVRPVRRTYTHLTCHRDTTMGLALAETYARDPEFYDGTFCCYCREHRPLTEFVWKGSEEKVGEK